jgi:hypothetical protein
MGALLDRIGHDSVDTGHGKYHHDKLEGLLTKPHEVKARRLAQGAAFELHVAWLLALYGFSTIVLGEYEHLFAEGTSVERGSVDVLAVHPDGKALIVVGCTIAAPEERDVGNLINLSEILAREVFHGTGVSVLPLLFTAAHGCDPYRELDGGFRLISIIDADRLGALLALIRQGQKERFFQHLQNPELCPIRPRYE